MHSKYLSVHTYTQFEVVYMPYTISRLACVFLFQKVFNAISRLRIFCNCVKHIHTYVGVTCSLEIQTTSRLCNAILESLKCNFGISKVYANLMIK